jgi:hypothetical protein
MEPDEQQQARKKVHRSPNYPAFSLPEAIEKARVVYDHEKRSFTTPDVIVRHLGYSQTTGPGGRAISALRQYGILEEQDGRIRISDTGFALIHYPEDAAERAEAMRVAIRRPALFRELLTEYKDGLPSDDTLRSNLLRRGFNPASIAEAVKNFRDTVSLESHHDSWYTDGEARDMHVSAADQMTARDSAAVQMNSVSHSNDSGKRTKETAIVRQDIFSLPEGQVTIQWPATMSDESYQDLADWLDILKRKIGRSVRVLVATE